MVAPMSSPPRNCASRSTRRFNSSGVTGGSHLVALGSAVACLALGFLLLGRRVSPGRGLLQLLTGASTGGRKTRVGHELSVGFRVAPA
jgi:hypothetical protein